MGGWIITAFSVGTLFGLCLGAILAASKNWESDAGDDDLG